LIQRSCALIKRFYALIIDPMPRFINPIYALIQKSYALIIDPMPRFIIPVYALIQRSYALIHSSYASIHNN
jgi:predicted DNA-binding protein (MmcQ/YjbR family)